MDDTNTILIYSGIIILVIFLALATQRWFWGLFFGISALASLFTMIACIIHLQILSALGLFFLFSISFSMCRYLLYID